jgi:hypothetical protein
VKDLDAVVLDEMSDHQLLAAIAANTAGTHAELVKLNEALQAGSLNIRTHHPLCVTPKDGDYTVQQLEVMGKYLNQSIETGALELPQKGAQS